MKDLSITERRIKDVLILDLAGKVLIGTNASKLRSTLRSYLDRGERRLLLNLAEVTHIDSSGLGDIVAGHVSFEKAGGALKLLNLTDRVSDLMMITKLVTVFETFAVEDDAVESFETGTGDSNVESVPAASGAHQIL